MLKGIDISVWQGEVDFLKLKNNEDIDFIIIRSSYGTGFVDKQFVRNRSEVRRLGIPHGYYHYSYPNHNTPEAEADWFLEVVGKLEHGEVLVLDFEEKYPDPVTWSKKFLDRVSSKLDGYKPIIYLNKHLVQSYDWSSVVKANYGLWLAYWDYNPDAPLPDLPYWKTVAMRQYTSDNKYDGIPSDRVDANVFYGDLDTFYKYGVQLDDVDPTEPAPFNFDHTKRLPENAWLLLGYDKYAAIPRSTALDTLGKEFQSLFEKYQQKLLECPESEQLQLQIAELINKNKKLTEANTELNKANDLLGRDNIWLEQDRDSWKAKAEGELLKYDLVDLVVAIFKKIGVKNS